MATGPVFHSARGGTPGPARALLVVVLALTMLVACADEPVRDLRVDEVVGTWTSRGGGSFEFAADGTFVASDLRGEALMPQYEGRRLAGTGRWELRPYYLRKDGPVNHVHLIFDRHDPGGPNGWAGAWSGDLTADFDRFPLALFFYIDDPDLNKIYRFTRTG